MIKTARFYILLLLFCDLLAGLSLYSLVWFFKPEGYAVWAFYINAFIFLLGCLAFIFIILSRSFSRGIFFRQMNGALKLATVSSFNIVGLVILYVYNLANYKAVGLLILSQIIFGIIIRFIKGR